MLRLWRRKRSARIGERDFGMLVALGGLEQRGYRPAVVYDVGAAHGGWARTALPVWHTATVVCFEPLAERAGELERFRAQCPGRVHIVPCGVGDVETTLEIGFDNSPLEASFAYAAKQRRPVECQFLPFCEEMRTLDATIAHMSALGFILYEFVDLLRRPLDGAMGQCDILFVRRGHPLVLDLRWHA